MAVVPRKALRLSRVRPTVLILASSVPVLLACSALSVKRGPNVSHYPLSAEPDDHEVSPYTLEQSLNAIAALWAKIPRPQWAITALTSAYSCPNGMRSMGQQNTFRHLCDHQHWHLLRSCP